MLRIEIRHKFNMKKFSNEISQILGNEKYYLQSKDIKILIWVYIH